MPEAVDAATFMIAAMSPAATLILTRAALRCPAIASNWAWWSLPLAVPDPAISGR
jgi:hypothetical protein